MSIHTLADGDCISARGWSGGAERGWRSTESVFHMPGGCRGALSHNRGLLEEDPSKSAVSRLTETSRDSSPEARGKGYGYSHVVNSDR